MVRKVQSLDFIQFWRPNDKEGPKFSNNIENFLLFLSFRCDINFSCADLSNENLKNWYSLNRIELIHSIFYFFQGRRRRIPPLWL
jgi:hypothetical protein